MINNQPSHAPNNASWVFGVLLILLGIFFLIAQVVDFNVASLFWPFFIIVPGVMLIALGLSLRTESGEGLTIVGSVTTMTGLLLFYQNSTGNWATWSYGWALLAPTAIGLGQLFYGSVRSRPELVRQGSQMAGIGFLVFLAGAFFFEVLVGVSGGQSRMWAWPLLLIAAGVVLVVVGFWRKDKGSQDRPV